MDENRLNGSFRDELGLAIEAAMGVEPAPELKVLVRARIDRERVTTRRWNPWQLATVGAAVAAIVAIAAVAWRGDPNQIRPPSVIAALDRSALAPYAAVAQAVAPAVDRTIVPVRAGEVSVSNQAAILAAYVNHVRQLRIDPSAVAVRASSEPLKLSGINIERIAIEPLPKLDAIAGERQ